MNTNNVAIKEMDFLDRPYEKALLYGIEALTDSELLAVFIRSGTKDFSALNIADQILAVRNGKLRNLLSLTLDELTRIPGIGKTKAIQLKAVAEIGSRIQKSRLSRKLVLNQPDTIADYFMEMLKSADREKLIAVFFDSKSGLIAYRIIAVGGKNVAPVSPDIIFREAVNVNASYLVLIHNHPSGDPTPSDEDIKVTKRIKECGLIMNIPLSDHIIIGDSSYYSFYEHSAAF